MKNILILTQELYPDKIGGSAKVAWQQAQIFADLKYKVTIITTASNNAVSHKSIKVISYPNLNKSKSLNDLIEGKKAIRNILNKNNFHLVIIHHPYIGKAFLTLKTKLPYIYMFHSSTALETKWQGLDIAHKNNLIGSLVKPFFVHYTKQIETQLLTQAKQIWVLSNFSEALIKKYFYKVGSKIKKIPYITDLKNFTPPQDKTKLRNEFNIDQKDLLAISVRRLVPRMGLEWLIKAWPSVIKKYPHLKLLIVGNGYLRPQLEKLIAQHKLGNKILLIGKLPETTLIKYYQASDIFILPTLAYEGFGLATVEALSCGLPVIGTNIGATPEIINAFDKHLLLQNIDSPALLNCIDYALINKKELSIKTRQFCENNFNQTKTQTFADLLSKIL